MTPQITEQNAFLLEKLSLYLNLMPRAIDKDMVLEMAGGKSASKQQKEYALAALLCAYCGLDTSYDSKHKELFHSRFLKMVHIENPNAFTQNPFYKNIRVPSIKKDNWEITNKSFMPYEAFVADELCVLPDGSIMPNIGFFEQEFTFPAVLQDGREWMTITPHEIRTTQPALDKARGKVATYGLGLGYFAYMASIKQNVESVAVIELDKNVISLFEQYILPQFPNREKKEIINANAFDFAKNVSPKRNFDFVFADTWHDPSDGIEMYNKFKKLEHFCSNTEFCYWIEYTLKYYMETMKQ